MGIRVDRRLVVVAGSSLVVGAAVCVALFLRVRATVRDALDAPLESRRPLEFVDVPVPSVHLESWGSGDVDSLAATPSTLWTAGGFGVSDGERIYDTTSGLPTLRVSGLALWRGEPVVAPAGGGLFRLQHGRWAAARSGWGTLHIRALVETDAGELLIGAREGLYRAAWGATRLERLDTRPVRSIAAGSGFVLAGGEQGLVRVETGRVVPLETPDPWVEAVALDDHGDAVVLTAAGLARGRLGSTIAPVAGGEDVTSVAVHRGTVYGLAGDASRTARRFDNPGRITEEGLPAPARRLLVSGETLFADTSEGLYRRGPGGWTPTRKRPSALPPGSVHVGALAWQAERLVIGMFDGGLVLGQPTGGGRPVTWRTVPGSSAWGVNALLPAGGALYVASLRGAARFDGDRLTPVEGPGAAFSLAATSDGVAIGYGQGVLLPGSRLLSAFHGLPGNQALALAWGGALFVGTPSGLGAVDGRRVRWRVTPGEGRLPNPWVTALLLSGDSLYVGTYGGGVVRRSAPEGAGVASWSDAGAFDAFVETGGLKVSTGSLVEAAGRIYVGTDGRGVYRLSRDGRSFSAFPLPLPSPRVTALLVRPGALYIGTDEGVARLPLDDDGRSLQEEP